MRFLLHPVLVCVLAAVAGGVSRWLLEGAGKPDSGLGTPIAQRAPQQRSGGLDDASGTTLRSGSGVPASELELLAALARSFPAGERARYLYVELGRRLGKRAVEMALGEPGNEALEGAVAGWAMEEPGDAVNWVWGAGEARSRRSSLLKAIIGQAADDGSLRELARVLADLKPKNGNDHGDRAISIRSLSEKWATLNRDTAVKWIDSIPAGDALTRRDALIGALTVLAGEDPATYAAWAAAHASAGPERAAAVGAAVAKWVETRPVGEVETWLRGMDRTPDLDAAYAKVATAKVNDDFAGALELGAGLTDSGTAILTAGLFAARTEPALVPERFQQAEAMAAGRFRSALLQSMATKWARSSPGAAVDHITNSPNLGDEERQKLLRAIER